jgi:SAM-dependent methyltransferase
MTIPLCYDGSGVVKPLGSLHSSATRDATALPFLFLNFTTIIMSCEHEAAKDVPRESLFVHRGMLSQFSGSVNPRKVSLIDAYGVGDSLLDVGCGNGLYTLATRRRFSKVLQIDIADRRAPQAAGQPFILMDANEVASVGGKFDTVLCFDIIEHLDDDGGFARKLRLVCTGCVIGSVPASDDARLRSIGLTHLHHVDKTHRREYTADSVSALLREAGFTDITVIPQYNDGIVNFARALTTATFLSRLLGKGLIVCTRWLCRVGIFRNESVADWLFVARVAGTP